MDKIVGPGNAFVNEAKLLVAHDVAVDLPAGPSEVVVLASAGADLGVAELELAAQREHGPDAVCRLVEADGDLEGALARVEELAPEHLVLLGEEAEALAPRVRNAGAVFVGRWSPVAAGDYATGGNHVLPTGGRARAVGGLGLEAFLKPVTVQRLTPAGAGAACARSSRRSPRSRACPPTRRRCGDEDASAGVRRLLVGAVDARAGGPARPRPDRDRPLRRQRPGLARPLVAAGRARRARSPTSRTTRTAATRS